MRETKFRAWVEAYKIMEYIDDWYWFEENGVHNSNGSGHYCSFSIMQYTGLKDKNGKEIYEGDIVRLDNRDIGGSITVGEVMFNTDQTLSRLEWGLWTKRGYHWTDFLGYLEVIGNIYENPELIK